MLVLVCDVAERPRSKNKKANTDYPPTHTASEVNINKDRKVTKNVASTKNETRETRRTNGTTHEPPDNTDEQQSESESTESEYLSLQDYFNAEPERCINCWLYAGFAFTKTIDLGEGDSYGKFCRLVRFPFSAQQAFW